MNEQNPPRPLAYLSRKQTEELQSLLASVSYGEIKLHVQQGRVVKYSVTQSYLPQTNAEHAPTRTERNGGNG